MSRVPGVRRKPTVRKEVQKLCFPRSVRIANRLIFEGWAFATPWSRPSTGFCGHIDARFAVTTFSCCGGWLLLAGRPKLLLATTSGICFGQYSTENPSILFLERYEWWRSGHLSLRAVFNN